MMLNEITLFEDLLCCDSPTLKENDTHPVIAYTRKCLSLMLVDEKA